MYEPSTSGTACTRTRYPRSSACSCAHASVVLRRPDLGYSHSLRPRRPSRPAPLRLASLSLFSSTFLARPLVSFSPGSGCSVAHCRASSARRIASPACLHVIPSVLSAARTAGVFGWQSFRPGWALLSLSLSLSFSLRVSRSLPFYFILFFFFFFLLFFIFLFFYFFLHPFSRRFRHAHPRALSLFFWCFYSAWILPETALELARSNDGCNRQRERILLLVMASLNNWFLHPARQFLSEYRQISEYRQHMNMLQKF